MFRVFTVKKFAGELYHPCPDEPAERSSKERAARNELFCQKRTWTISLGRREVNYTNSRLRTWTVVACSEPLIGLSELLSRPHRLFVRA